ncbi:MAG: TlpA family protein disulfide reductase [Alistipes sp.]|nr:TlpA family protein disulfide reductase [Alistipes sp.]MBR5586217.1 TlpA family protein disulfide reductase [Alistipes sp.]MBR6544118.1 TlpA family protein disulfide reductase [Alistipes sp.]
MKKLMFLMLALMVGVSASAQNLPDVKVESQEAKVISTLDLVDGTPMIISFWSTTCKPCIMELNAINDNLVDWLEEVDMKVVAVSVDDARTVSRARAMTKGQGWDDYVCVYDKNQDFKRAMNVSLTPHTFIVDGKGKIVYSHSGYTPGSEQELFEKIKALK